MRPGKIEDEAPIYTRVLSGQSPKLLPRRYEKTFFSYLHTSHMKDFCYEQRVDNGKFRNMKLKTICGNLRRVVDFKLSLAPTIHIDMIEA